MSVPFSLYSAVLLLTLYRAPIQFFAKSVPTKLPHTVLGQSKKKKKIRE